MDMHAPRAEEAMLVISASLRGPERLNLTPSEVNVPDFHLAPPLGQTLQTPEAVLVDSPVARSSAYLHDEETEVRICKSDRKGLPDP